MVKQCCAANGRSPVLEIKFSSAPKVQDTEISTLEHLLGKRQIWMKKEAEKMESKSWKHDPESQQNKLEVNKWMTVRLRMCWLQKSELLVQSLSKMAPFSIIMLLLVIVNGFSAGH